MGCELVPAGPAREKCYELQRKATNQTTGPVDWSPYADTLPDGRPRPGVGVNVPKTWDQIWVDTSNMTGVAGASDLDSTTYNVRVPERSQVPVFGSLPANEQAFFTQAAKAIHPLKTGKSYYEELIEASWDLSKDGIYKSPQALAYAGLTGNLGSTRGGGGSSGFGFGGGAAPEPLDASAVRRAMDTLARNSIGRTLSNREFRDYYRQYKSEFAGNPDMDMQQNGIEALQRNDDYQEYQVATKFADAMKSVIRGVAT